MTDQERKDLLKKYQKEVDDFKKDVCDDSNVIDPNDELDWFTLSYGYFLAKGMNAVNAYTLSIIVRYDLRYWK